LPKILIIQSIDVCFKPLLWLFISKSWFWQNGGTWIQVLINEFTDLLLFFCWFGRIHRDTAIKWTKMSCFLCIQFFFKSLLQNAVAVDGGCASSPGPPVSAWPFWPLPHSMAAFGPSFRPLGHDRPLSCLVTRVEVVGCKCRLSGHQLGEAPSLGRPLEGIHRRCFEIGKFK
jgi:hypothetical protein